MKISERPFQELYPNRVAEKLKIYLLYLFMKSSWKLKMMIMTLVLELVDHHKHRDWVVWLTLSLLDVQMLAVSCILIMISLARILLSEPNFSIKKELLCLSPESIYQLWKARLSFQLNSSFSKTQSKAILWYKKIAIKPLRVIERVSRLWLTSLIKIASIT